MLLLKSHPFYEEETAMIRENAKKPEATRRHTFRPAQWTHPNGHPRCLLCGDEEPEGGYCEGLKKGEVSKGPLLSFAEIQAYAKKVQQKRIQWRGLPITIENPKGSFRHWKDSNGTPRSTEMSNDYGEFAGTLGMDGDPLDVIIGPDENAGAVYIAMIAHKPAFDTPDEEKVLVNFASPHDARTAMVWMYDDPRFLFSMRTVGIGQFLEEIKRRYAVPSSPVRKSSFPLLFKGIAQVRQHMRRVWQTGQRVPVREHGRLYEEGEGQHATYGRRDKDERQLPLLPLEETRQTIQQIQARRGFPLSMKKEKPTEQPSLFNQPKKKEEEPAVEEKKKPHEMTRNDYEAKTIAKEHREQRWLDPGQKRYEIYHRGNYEGLSFAATPEQAVKRFHDSEVNNALYRKERVAQHILDEHPDIPMLHHPIETKADPDPLHHHGKPLAMGGHFFITKNPEGTYHLAVSQPNGGNTPIGHDLHADTVEKLVEQYAQKEKQPEAKERGALHVERGDHAPFVVNQGDRVKVWMSHGKFSHGTVAGISVANKQARVIHDGSVRNAGVWHDQGTLYPPDIESPAIKKKGEKALLSRVLSSVNKEPPGGWTASDKVPSSSVTRFPLAIKQEPEENYFFQDDDTGKIALKLSKEQFNKLHPDHQSAIRSEFQWSPDRNIWLSRNSRYTYRAENVARTIGMKEKTVRKSRGTFSFMRKGFTEEAVEVLEQRHALSEKIKVTHESIISAVDARNRNPHTVTHEARLQDLQREAASLPDELDRLDRRIRQLQRSGALRFGPLRHSRDSADNVNQKSGFWLTLRKAA